MARTTIALDAALFEQAEVAAKELGLSRSQLFAIALREFLDHEENCTLLQRLNAVASKVSFEDPTLLAAMKRKQRRIVVR